MSEQIARPAPIGRPRVGIATVVALALATGFVTWMLLERGDSAQVPTATSTAVPAASSIATTDGLGALAGTRGRPVYWAGPREGVVYEVTENSQGYVYIRYLPSGSELGSPRPDYLSVATYPRPDAFANVEAAAKRPGAVSIGLVGGLAVYDEASPTSIYVAYRGSSDQVEVYSPSASEARRVVESGQVRPVP